MMTGRRVKVLGGIEGQMTGGWWLGNVQDARRNADDDLMLHISYDKGGNEWIKANSSLRKWAWDHSERPQQTRKLQKFIDLHSPPKAAPAPLAPTKGVWGINPTAALPE